MGLLIGLGAFLACLVAGGILLGLGHVIIGFVVLLASVPCAIVAWIKWNDRSYG
jgi:predicted permease